MRLRLLLLGLGLLVSSCAGPGLEVGDTVLIDDFDAESFQQRLSQSARPMVVNVWASWCVPCRSEAPLFAEAHRRFGAEVDFIGIDIQDTRAGAQAFLDEFGIGYSNLFDPGGGIRGILGGSGVPITYFVGPGGEPVRTHFGVIDEQALALQIDELLAESG